MRLLCVSNSRQTVVFLKSTVRLVKGTVRLVKGTVQLVKGTVRLVKGTLRKLYIDPYCILCQGLSPLPHHIMSGTILLPIHIYCGIKKVIVFCPNGNP